MKVTVFVGISVDGFLARADGGLDWLPETCEPHGYEELVAAVDAMVIGRGTFETVLGFPSWPYGRKPVVVLSAKPEALSLPDGVPCEAMAGAPAEILARLEARGWRHLYLDGGITIQRFLEARLVQRLVITRIPILLGSGIPLFGPLSRDVRLRHLGTRAFASGMVQSEYEVEG